MKILDAKQYSDCDLEYLKGNDRYVRLLVLSDLEALSLGDKSSNNLRAGQEFIGVIESNLGFGRRLELYGPMLEELVTIKPISSAIKTDYGRLLLTDRDGGKLLLELLLPQKP